MINPHFSRPLAGTVAGEEVSPAPLPALRTLGQLAGMLPIPGDFDAPLPDDVLDAFEGR